MLNIVTHAREQAEEIGDELVENPKVRRINFTGSTAVGRKLAEAAGRNLKRVVLELGGSNPLIVLGDADLDYAVDAAAFGAFMHQGQICMSARRIIVERPIADAFIDRLVAKTNGLKAGDPNEHDTIIGPLITPDALALVKGRVEQAVADGARVLAGGEPSAPATRRRCSRTSPPTRSSRRSRRSGRSRRSRSSRAPRRRSARERHELRALRGHPDRRQRRGLALAAGIEAGIVHVNDQPVHDEPQMPFGGVKDSGWGRFGGTRGDARVHRAALGHGPERHPAVPLLTDGGDRRTQGGDRRTSCATATPSRSRASPT